MTKVETQIMKQEDPPIKKCSNQSLFEAKKNYLIENEGVWFVFYEKTKSASYVYQLRNQLCGFEILKGVNKTKLEFEVEYAANDDGTYRIYARYTPRAPHDKSSERL